MTQLYASVALGTAATVMALTLLLLRINVYSGRAALTFARRWITTSNSASFAVLAPLAAIALCSFAAIPALHVPINDRQSVVGSVSSSETASADGGALNSLRAYVAKLDSDGNGDGVAAQTSAAAELPAVDIMVSKLIARLQDQPNDVAGWKMLGWSYLNTNRPDDAVQAYETALQLAPSDTEVEKALQAARSSKSETPSAVATQSTPHVAAEPSGATLEQDAMVRGMVDRLAARLKTSPNDEDGWTQLIRSRMVLGEKSGASTALSQALATFASDTAAKDRLTAVARSLGVEQAPSP